MNFKTENQVSVYRDKPLNPDSFQKLDKMAADCFSFRDKNIYRSMPVKDDLGNIYRWEHHLVQAGAEIFLKTAPDPRLMVSLLRPATDLAVGIHLSRLQKHKPYCSGPEGFRVIVDDLTHDMRDCSEWALYKTCEKFRLDTELRYFPDTARLVSETKDIQNMLAALLIPAADPTKLKISAPKIEPFNKPTVREKRRVRCLVKIGVKPKGIWTKWEQRWFAAVGKKL